MKNWRLHSTATLALASVFLSVSCVWPYKLETNFWLERNKTHQILATLVLKNPLPKPTSFNFSPKMVSYKWGTIRGVEKPVNPNGKTIFHIQDVHMNIEAQSNISHMIKDLSTEKRIDLVALEGAFSAIDVSNFRNFPESQIIHFVADIALKEKQISGAIHAALTMPSPAPKFIGVDDKIHYGRNVHAFRISASMEESFKKFWEKTFVQLDRQKEKLFNPALRAFDTGIQLFHQGRKTTGEYAQILAKQSLPLGPEVRQFIQAQDLETHLNLPRVESERAEIILQLSRRFNEKTMTNLLSAATELKIGTVSEEDFIKFLLNLSKRAGINISRFPALENYINYILACNRLNPDQLLKELQEVEDAGYSKLATTPQEKRLTQLSHFLNLAKKLSEFSLTPDEWKKFEETKARFLVPIPNLASFEQFYLEAQTRDDRMAANVINAMKAPDIKNAVLVTGGFHAPGIEKKLVEKGFTVIPVVPRLTQANIESGSNYLNVFTQDKTPLEKLVQGQKLFMAPPAWGRVVVIHLAMMGALRKIWVSLGRATKPQVAKILKRLAGERIDPEKINYSPKKVSLTVQGTQLGWEVDPVKGDVKKEFQFHQKINLWELFRNPWVLGGLTAVVCLVIYALTRNWIITLTGFPIVAAARARGQGKNRPGGSPEGTIIPVDLTFVDSDKLEALEKQLDKAYKKFKGLSVVLDYLGPAFDYQQFGSPMNVMDVSLSQDVEQPPVIHWADPSLEDYMRMGFNHMTQRALLHTEKAARGELTEEDLQNHPPFWTMLFRWANKRKVEIKLTPTTFEEWAMNHFSMEGKNLSVNAALTPQVLKEPSGQQSVFSPLKNSRNFSIFLSGMDTAVEVAARMIRSRYKQQFALMEEQSRKEKPVVYFFRGASSGLIHKLEQQNFKIGKDEMSLNPEKINYRDTDILHLAERRAVGSPVGSQERIDIYLRQLLMNVLHYISHHFVQKRGEEIDPLKDLRYVRNAAARWNRNELMVVPMLVHNSNDLFTFVGSWFANKGTDEEIDYFGVRPYLQATTRQNFIKELKRMLGIHSNEDDRPEDPPFPWGDFSMNSVLPLGLAAISSGAFESTQTILANPEPRYWPVLILSGLFVFLMTIFRGSSRRSPRPLPKTPQEALEAWGNELADVSSPDSPIVSPIPMNVFVSIDAKFGWTHPQTKDSGLYGAVTPPLLLEDGRSIIPMVGDIYETVSVEEQMLNGQAVPDLKEWVKPRDRYNYFSPSVNHLDPFFQIFQDLPGFPSLTLTRNYEYSQTISVTTLKSLIWILKEKNVPEFYEWLAYTNRTFENVISLSDDEFIKVVPFWLLILADNIHWGEYYEVHKPSLGALRWQNYPRGPFQHDTYGFHVHMAHWFKMYQELGDYLDIKFSMMELPKEEGSINSLPSSTTKLLLQKLHDIQDRVLDQELKRLGMSFKELEALVKKKNLNNVIRPHVWYRGVQAMWDEWASKNPGNPQIGKIQDEWKKIIESHGNIRNLDRLVTLIRKKELDKTADNISIKVKIRKLSAEDYRKRLGLEQLRGEEGLPAQLTAWTFPHLVGRLAFFFGVGGGVKTTSSQGIRMPLKSPQEFLEAFIQGREFGYFPARLDFKGLGTAKPKLHRFVENENIVTINEDKSLTVTSMPDSFTHRVSEITGKNLNPRVLLELEENGITKQIGVTEFIQRPGIFLRTRYQPGFPSPRGTQLKLFGAETIHGEKKMAELGGRPIYDTRAQFILGEPPSGEEVVAGDVRLTEDDENGPSLRLAEAMEEFRLSPEKSLLGKLKAEGQLENYLRRFFLGLGNNHFALVAMGKVLVLLGAGRFLHMRLGEKTPDLAESYLFFLNNTDINSGRLGDFGDFDSLKDSFNDIAPQRDTEASIALLLSMAAEFLDDLTRAGIIEPNGHLKNELLNLYIEGFTHSPNAPAPNLESIRLNKVQFSGEEIPVCGEFGKTTNNYKRILQDTPFESAMEVLMKTVKYFLRHWPVSDMIPWESGGMYASSPTRFSPYFDYLSSDHGISDSATLSWVQQLTRERPAGYAAYVNDNRFGAQASATIRPEYRPLLNAMERVREKLSGVNNKFEEILTAELAEMGEPKPPFFEELKDLLLNLHQAFNTQDSAVMLQGKAIPLEAALQRLNEIRQAMNQPAGEKDGMVNPGTIGILWLPILFFLERLGLRHIWAFRITSSAAAVTEGTVTFLALWNFGFTSQAAMVSILLLALFHLAGGVYVWNKNIQRWQLKFFWQFKGSPHKAFLPFAGAAVLASAGIIPLALFSHLSISTLAPIWVLITGPHLIGNVVLTFLVRLKTFELTREVRTIERRIESAWNTGEKISPHVEAILFELSYKKPAIHDIGKAFDKRFYVNEKLGRSVMLSHIVHYSKEMKRKLTSNFSKALNSLLHASEWRDPAVIIVHIKSAEEWDDFTQVESKCDRKGQVVIGIFEEDAGAEVKIEEFDKASHGVVLIKLTELMADAAGLYSYDDVLGHKAIRQIPAIQLLNKNKFDGGQIFVVSRHAVPFTASERLARIMAILINLGEGWVHTSLSFILNAAQIATNHA